MTTKQLLVESTSVPVATKVPGRWRATLITPGVGSSGNWLEETIKRDGPHALKKGAKCFVTHNRLENGEPDPFRMWGVLADDSFYEEGNGLVADIDVLPSWRDRVEEVAPHTALSVYIMGESDEDKNVTAILEDVQNGVDLVAYPGRPGSALVEKLYESAKPNSVEESPAAPVVENEDTKGLLRMEQDVENRFNSLEAKIDGLVASKTTEAQANVDKEALDNAVAARVEAIKTSVAAVEAAKADLLPTQFTKLSEAAYRGEDVTSSIEDAKKLTAEAKTAFGEAAPSGGETGRFGESADASTYTLSGFGETA